MFEDNKIRHRFEWTEHGLTAFASYYEHAGSLVIPHIEAPEALRGKGAAGRLMEAVVGYARATHLKLKPTCPYAVVWFKRHPQATDVLA
jgi:predicted GNAT family acetyltransferase